SKIIEINDFEEIMKCDVKAIPALIINDIVVADGGVITKSQIAECI
ncbi:MAG: thioredoxin family protein, partial [PVC group bacterium]|nr:thioredoxin family protein [PVC group bacterium]